MIPRRRGARDEEPRGPARRGGVRDGEERGRERPRPGRVHEAEARGGGRREVHERVVPDHVGQRRREGARDRAQQQPPPPRGLPAARPQLLGALDGRGVWFGAGHGAVGDATVVFWSPRHSSLVVRSTGGV